MKTLKSIKLFILIFILIPLLATTSYNVTADELPTNNENFDNYRNSYDYVISSYDITVVVNENNTFQITEKIGAFFFSSKHGIYRKIPINNTVKRQDGTTSYIHGKTSDITVDSPYSTYNEAGNKVIKIGNKNQTLVGANEYTISYLYNIGKDKLINQDELYFNLIGLEWDTIINDVTFTIVMPKAFDERLLGFSSGRKGSTNSTNVTYQVNGNIITGKYVGVLNPGEGVTVRLELPNEYFIGASTSIDLWSIFVIIMSIILVFCAFLIWLKFGKDDQVVETVEFYPPDGLNSADVGFLYKGEADKTDVISLLIFLANKGFLKISETGKRSLFTKSMGFEFIKLRAYDGKSICEKEFLHGLFIKNDVVSLEDLQNKFYITLNDILKDLNSKKNKLRIFKKQSLTKGFSIKLMIAATLILVTWKPVVEYGGILLVLFPLLFTAPVFCMVINFLFSKNKIPIKIVVLILGIIFTDIYWKRMIYGILLANPIYLIIYIVGHGCVAVLILFLKLMPNRTVYGNEMLGKISGFKTFLETVEKSKLELCVMNDPEYFYNILPYTYVLGVSDKWINKFESIYVQAPNWYEGSSSFHIATFGGFMNSTMSSSSNAMSSRPSSGGGLGGSSGGGSGGGGGGSW